MDLALLDQTLADAGQPAFRARQVWAWMARGAASYAEMTDLPADLRARLEEHVPFSSLEVVNQVESRDGTVKALFHTADRRPIEAVLMRYRDGRRSVSSTNSTTVGRPCGSFAVETTPAGLLSR